MQPKAGAAELDAIVDRVRLDWQPSVVLEQIALLGAGAVSSR